MLTWEISAWGFQTIQMSWLMRQASFLYKTFQEEEGGFEVRV